MFSELSSDLAQCLIAKLTAHRALEVSGSAHCLPFHVLRVEHHQLALKAAAHAAQ